MDAHEGRVQEIGCFRGTVVRIPLRQRSLLSDSAFLSTRGIVHHLINYLIYTLYYEWCIIIIVLTSPLQAADKGVSSFVVGFIVGCSPLCVTLFSPLFGYFVSGVCDKTYHNRNQWLLVWCLFDACLFACLMCLFVYMFDVFVCLHVWCACLFTCLMVVCLHVWCFFVVVFVFVFLVTSIRRQISHDCWHMACRRVLFPARVSFQISILTGSGKLDK